MLTKFSRLFLQVNNKYFAKSYIPGKQSALFATAIIIIILFESGNKAHTGTQQQFKM